ncbi:MAG: cupin domain-containing protein [Arenimonas sp.]
MNTKNDQCLDILLAANAGLIPKLAPTEAVRQRMLANIMQRVEVPTMQVTRKNEGQWLDILPGISIKILHENIAEQSQTTLWRLQAGACVPRHQHKQSEECLVLEGSIIHAGVEYFSGDYLLAPVGMPHDVLSAPNGAMFLIRGEIIDKAMML